MDWASWCVGAGSFNGLVRLNPQRGLGEHDMKGILQRVKCNEAGFTQAEPLIVAGIVVAFAGVILAAISSSRSFSCLRLPIGIKMLAAPSIRTAPGVSLPMLGTWDYSVVNMKMRPEDTVASGRYT
jgi:hypothetical protein